VASPSHVGVRTSLGCVRQALLCKHLRIEHLRLTSRSSTVQPVKDVQVVHFPLAFGLKIQ
jgi:hypothetical protein